MCVRDTLTEFSSEWLPHVTDDGLERLIELLASGSPLLIHGAFSRACAMGCLATHIAWHHPRTRSLNEEAGVVWLTRVAGLNPATSRVILDWDRGGAGDWGLRTELLHACTDEMERRLENAGESRRSDGYIGDSRVTRSAPPAACDPR